MPQQMSKQRAPDIQAYDPIWDTIRAEAEDITRREPALSSFILANVLNHASLKTRSATGSRSASIMMTSTPT